MAIPVTFAAKTIFPPPPPPEHLQWRSQPDIWSCKCKFFGVYRPYKDRFLKKWIMTMIQICIAWPNCRAGFATKWNVKFNCILPLYHSIYKVKDYISLFLALGKARNNRHDFTSIFGVNFRIYTKLLKFKYFSRML